MEPRHVEAELSPQIGHSCQSGKDTVQETHDGLDSVPGYLPFACPAGRVRHRAEEESLCLLGKYCPDWASPFPG